MSNRNRPSGIEREIRRRHKRRMAELNRNDRKVLTTALQIAFVAIAIIAGITIWFWAAEKQAMEVEAAVLRAHRITDGPLYGPGEIPLVEPLPLTPPEDGAPPQAIEIRMATKAEAIPAERWESLGRWKLTAYCPERCCNGRNAHRTASGEPMVVGDTVAVGSLPFGTKIKINDQIYTVTDRGVKGHHVDILFPSHGEAKQFGVQYAEVFVLR